MMSESALTASMTLWSRVAASALAESALASTLVASGRTGSAGVSARVRDSTVTRATRAAERASHRDSRPAAAREAGKPEPHMTITPGRKTDGESARPPCPFQLGWERLAL